LAASLRKEMAERISRRKVLAVVTGVSIGDGGAPRHPILALSKAGGGATARRPPPIYTASLIDEGERPWAMKA
jgi:hypothetical protein